MLVPVLICESLEVAPRVSPKLGHLLAKALKDFVLVLCIAAWVLMLLLRNSERLICSLVHTEGNSPQRIEMNATF